MEEDHLNLKLAQKIIMEKANENNDKSDFEEDDNIDEEKAGTK